MTAQTTDSRPFPIQIECRPMGEDLVFLITGGKAHIGAVATAWHAEGMVMTKVHTVPGHREDQLACEWAEAAARGLGCSVTVAAGIHVDQATREMIHAIVEEVNRQMKQTIQELIENRQTEANGLS